MLRSMVVGHILGKSMLTASEERKVAVEALGSVPPDAMPEEPEPYVIITSAL